MDQKEQAQPEQEDIVQRPVNRRALALVVGTFAILGFVSILALRAAGVGSYIEAEGGQLDDKITSCQSTSDDISGGSYIVLSGDCIPDTTPEPTATPTEEPTTSPDVTATPTPTPASGSFSLPDSPKIMAIGDSITDAAFYVGSEDNIQYTWRYPLQDHLIAASCSYEMVGTQVHPTQAGQQGYIWSQFENGEYDAAKYEPYNGHLHQSIGAASTQDVLDDMNGSNAFTLAPDIAVIHIGTNNHQGQAALRQMITGLRSANADVVILLALPHERGNVVSDWQAIAADIGSDESPILTVDLAGNVEHNGTNFLDSVHPSETGSSLFADEFYEVLAPVLATNANICSA